MSKHIFYFVIVSSADVLLKPVFNTYFHDFARRLLNSWDLFYQGFWSQLEQLEPDIIYFLFN